MMKNLWLCLYAILLITTACTKKVDVVKAREEIIMLLQNERKAHFEKDIDAFVTTFADSIVSVYDGEVEVHTSEANKARFGPYFNSVEFVKWDDLAEPIIDISEDGTMAYAVVKKEIVLTYPDTNGNSLTDSAQYAWVSIYRKIGDQWKTVCNASTHLPRD